MSKSSTLSHDHNHTHHNHSHTYDAEELMTFGLKQIKESGLKMTKKRKELLEIFANDQRYMSAQTVHQVMSEQYPTMSYNTTYRNIYDFVELGILEATEYDQEQLFRIHCIGEGHHHHFICHQCGFTIPLDTCPMSQVETDLSDVVIEQHRFEIFGLCKKCAAAEKQRKESSEN